MHTVKCPNRPAQAFWLIVEGKRTARAEKDTFWVFMEGKRTPYLKDRNQKNDSKATFQFLSEFREIEK